MSEHEGEAWRVASVLLVEQNEGTAQRLEHEIAAQGLLVQRTTQPLDAIRGSEIDPDVVVLSIPLEGIDSVAACAALKQSPAPPAVILLDSANLAAQIEAALPAQLRPDATVAKPVDASKLLQEIEKIVGRPGSAPETTGRQRGPSFPELLVDLKERSATGILEIRAEGVRTAVHFQQGDPVFAEGGALRQTLGRMLLRSGRIDEEDYMRVIQRMTEGLVQNEPLRMGEALIEFEILSPLEVYDALALQIREKILSCFHWERFESEFRPLDELPEEAASFGYGSVDALVLEGLKEHFHVERLRSVLQAGAERYPTLMGDVSELVERFRMSPKEERLLTTIRGDRTLAEVRRESSLDPLHTGQVIAALLIAKRLTLCDSARAPTPSSARPPASGATRSSEPTDSPEPGPAPDATAPRFADSGAAQRPPNPTPAGATRRDPPSASRLEMVARMRRTLEAIRRRPASAPGAAGEQRDEKQARLEAAQALHKGQRMLQQNLIGGALREFAKAVKLDGEQLEYQLYHAWAEYLAANGGEARTLTRAKARALAQKILQQDPNASKAHSILGRFLYDEGELEAAERHFHLALRSDAGDIEAQRGLRLIQKRHRHR